MKLISSFKENHQIDELEREILTLCKINTFSERFIINAISNIQIKHQE
jgi:hypothetical protein